MEFLNRYQYSRVYSISIPKMNSALRCQRFHRNLKRRLLHSFCGRMPKEHRDKQTISWRMCHPDAEQFNFLFVNHSRPDNTVHTHLLISEPPANKLKLEKELDHETLEKIAAKIQKTNEIKSHNALLQSSPLGIDGTIRGKGEPKKSFGGIAQISGNCNFANDYIDLIVIKHILSASNAGGCHVYPQFVYKQDSLLDYLLPDFSKPNSDRCSIDYENTD